MLLAMMCVIKYIGIFFISSNFYPYYVLILFLPLCTSKQWLVYQVWYAYHSLRSCGVFYS